MTLQQGFLEFDDATFWAEPVLPMAAGRKLLEAAPGLYLDGPRRASTAEHADLPYLGAWVASSGERQHLSLRRKGSLVTVRLEDNVVRAGGLSGVALSEAPIPPSGAASPGEDGLAAEAFETDLGKVGFRFEPGTYRTWAVLFECASNAVTTAVVAPEIVDPEVRALIAQHGDEVFAGPVAPPPGLQLPSYRRGLTSPVAPVEIGVVISAPRVTVAKETLPVIVHGSFKLPVLPGERVHPAEVAEAVRRRNEAIDEFSRQPMHDAVVTVHLLLIGNTRSTPEVVRLAVPALIDAGDGATATGYFSLDLRQHTLLEPQTYALWTIAGGELCGPVLAALVSPDLLPPTRSR